MGYAAGENPFSYPELKYDKIKLFIGEAAKLVDYIILDCSSNMLNFFTPTAIEAADVTVRIITPDLRGLNYLRAHRPLLTDDKFHSLYLPAVRYLRGSCCFLPEGSHPLYPPVP
mgnify:CR=1 FL=1